MATVVKDLGAVTAYAYAVAGGYSGTEAEFEALLGNIAEDLSEIENLSVTVTTLPAGSSATASYSNGVLSLGIPKGDKGDTGVTPNLSIGTVSTLPAGDNATATITGTAAAPVLNLGIPEGQAGDANNLAADYSSSKTYSVGEYCIYNGSLYRCITAITTAEAWTAAHWTAAVIGDDVGDLKSTVNSIMDSDYFSFFDLAWENGTLDNNGAEAADPGTNTRYRSAFIQPNSFETLVLFIPRFCYCYGYRYDSSKNFLGYVTGGWLGPTGDNQDGVVKIQSDGETSFYRFVFRALSGYGGSQRAITANDLSNTYCFHINRFPDDKSEISNLPFVIGGMEDYRNLTIPTNTARANTFFIPVASRHMVLSVPDGYQIYTWQLNGEFQYLIERGWSTGGMYYFLEADTKYIRFVAKTDNGSDTPSAEALKAVSVSFLSEIDKVPVNPLLRENTLIAHRGYSQTAPENTIPAIELAAEYGFKQVEVDLQFTSDGVCVLLHDNTINRTSNGTGNIYDMTYEDVLQYDFGSWKSAEYAGTKIPTLKEALLCCKYYGMCAQLDIADTNKTNITVQNLQTMLDVISETGMFSNVNICAEEDRARKVVALRPGVIMCIGVGDTEAKFNARKDIADGCALLIGSNSVSTSTDVMMERCHKNGMPYQIWTIDAADAAIAKFKAGYDWIITNSLKPTDVS